MFNFSVQISGHHGLGGGGRVIVSKLYIFSKLYIVIEYNCQQLSVCIELFVGQSLTNSFYVNIVNEMM